MSRGARALKSAFAPLYVSKETFNEESEKRQKVSIEEPHFRLTSKKVKDMGGPVRTCIKKMWHYLFNFETSDLVTTYLYWSFRSSFAGVLSSFFALFFLLVILFSPIYWAYGKNLPECIVSNGDLISQDSDEAFYDAVSLSWTTLSTVVCLRCLKINNLQKLSQHIRAYLCR
mmetsp:Transcript_39435/g.59650  ORF Transcript_39435/g.59650 Transcript_39435/m.59650 type:complete len:172 (+) Transcript_39435:411-926(+)